MMRTTLTGNSIPTSQWLAVIALIIVTIAVYWRGLGGDFVYDDARQIADNPYIQDLNLLPEALVSDVWVFRGDAGSEPKSNYWRPVFVLYLAANQFLFGPDNPMGWHAANLLLHLVVVLLLWRMLLRLGVSALGGWALALLFAIHPVHVESVVWISGAPDLLSTLFMLLAWGCLVFPNSGVGRRVSSCLLFLLALLSKEIAVALPLIVMIYFYFWAPDSQPASRVTTRIRSAILASLPLWLTAVAWFAVRATIVAPFGVDVSWQFDALTLLANVPQLTLFYIEQCLFPWPLSPLYPLRPLSGTELTTLAWMAPLAWLSLGLALSALLATNRRLFALGGAIFILPLLPAMNLNAYLPEQIVHDRYLYLPLLGLLLMAYATVHGMASRIRETRGSEVFFSKAGGVGFASGFVLVVAALFIATWRYSPVWTSESNLWRRAVVVDPESSFAWSQLGVHLLDQKQPTLALDALNRSIELAGNAPALIGRAEILAQQGRHRAASQDLASVLTQQPHNVEAAERLALLYQQQGDLNAARQVLRRTLNAGPNRQCSLLTNLAVLNYLVGDKPLALSQLERAVSLTDVDLSGSCQISWLHLGRLSLELGDREQADLALSRYVQVSARFPEQAAFRQQAIAILEQD